MRLFALHSVLGVAIAASACSSSTLPPAGQVLLYVDTDAPLPVAADEVADPATPTPLFDRLRIEIYPPGASDPCSGCTREFSIDSKVVRRGQASIGVIPEKHGSGYRARVRLFRNAGTGSGEPRPGSTIESVVALPAVGEEGIVEASVVLHTGDVASPQGTLDAPIASIPGHSATSLVGTWPGARILPCTGEPGLSEACVPGGAFWMGDPRLDTINDAEYDGRLERLVVLSPFFIDLTEVSVSTMRASGLVRKDAATGLGSNPQEAGGPIANCTFTTAPGKSEQVPVNCISWDAASAYCVALGRTLPTEAQYEYVAGGLKSLFYPWGSDAPACEDAVFGRDKSSDTSSACVKLGASPAPSGSGKRDRVALGPREVVDIAGNIQEWVSDMWNRESEPCWGTGIFSDPQCNSRSPGDAPARSVRGGDWSSYGSLLRSGVRARVANADHAQGEQVGFRCVRPN
ncbi:MAG: SUMF1/EgtB/PvdO family nonheme iron enzyme [Polyangiaceae bacterium]